MRLALLGYYHETNTFSSRPTDYTAFEILHGEKFVLLDRRARIRGYYDVGDPQGFAQLLKDARSLVGGDP